LGYDTGVSIGFSLLIEGRGDLVECALIVSSERSEEMRGRKKSAGDEGARGSKGRERGEEEGRKREGHTETVANP